MRYCIGCKHLHFERSDPGYNTECTAGIGAEEASMSCKMGYWFNYLYGDGSLFDIEAAMRKANTCADFKERERQ